MAYVSQSPPIETAATTASSKDDADATARSDIRTEQKAKPWHGWVTFRLLSFWACVDTRTRPPERVRRCQPKNGKRLAPWTLFMMSMPSRSRLLLTRLASCFTACEN